VDFGARCAVMIAGVLDPHHSKGSSVPSNNPPDVVLLKRLIKPDERAASFRPPTHAQSADGFSPDGDVRNGSSNGSRQFRESTIKHRRKHNSIWR
jgi:hypothetical protein